MARYTKGKPPATPATPATTTTTTTTPGIKPTDPVRPDPIVEEEEGVVETYGGGTRTIVKDKVVNTSVHQFPTILNDGVPSKGNPYILKQGLDETKVNFGITVTGVGDANIVVSVNFYVDAFGDPDIELTPIVLDLDNIVTLS